MYVKRSIVSFFVIAFLSILIMCNLNGVFGMYLGINAPFSPVILILSIIVIYLSAPKKNSFSKIYLLGLFFFVSFWFIGMAGSLYDFISNYHVKQATREISTTIIIMTAYYLFMKSLKTKVQVDNFMLFLFYLFLLITIFGVLESYLGLKSIYHADENRSNGFFGNPNETGLQCNLMLLLAYFMFLNDRIKLPVFLVALGLGAYGAFLTFSKMAILIVIIGVVFFIFYTFSSLGRAKRVVTLRFIGFIVLIFYIVGFIVVPKFIEFGQSLSWDQRKRINDVYNLVVNRKIDKSTTSNRTIVIEEAILLVAKRPFTGYGLHSFSTSNLFSAGFGIHNTFIKIVGEAGIFSLFIFLLYLGVLACMSIIHLPWNYRFFVLGLLLILTLFSFASHTVLSRKFFIPFLGIITALNSMPILYRKNANA